MLQNLPSRNKSRQLKRKKSRSVRKFSWRRFQQHLYAINPSFIGYVMVMVSKVLGSNYNSNPKLILPITLNLPSPFFFLRSFLLSTNALVFPFILSTWPRNSACLLLTLLISFLVLFAVFIISKLVLLSVHATLGILLKNHIPIASMDVDVCFVINHDSHPYRGSNPNPPNLIMAFQTISPSIHWKLTPSDDNHMATEEANLDQ